jgi:CheY-like chemotaxis protein
MQVPYEFADRQALKARLESVSETRELDVPRANPLPHDGDWVAAHFGVGNVRFAVAARACVEAQAAHLIFEDRDWERLHALLSLPAFERVNLPAQPKVLLVDYDTDTCQVVSALLDQAGYHTTVAHSPEAAFELLQRGDWQLLVVDCQIAGKGSPGFCRRIRGDGRSGKVPILFMSVRDEQEVARDTRAAGADDFIMKSFRAPELVARAQSLLSVPCGIWR